MTCKDMFIEYTEILWLIFWLSIFTHILLFIILPPIKKTVIKWAMYPDQSLKDNEEIYKTIRGSKDGH